jgi:phosphopantetheinyl transferase (holo-ACP synthase)
VLNNVGIVEIKESTLEENKMDRKVKNVIKSYEKMNEEDLKVFMDYLAEDKVEEVKDEVKEDVVEKVVVDKDKKEFITKDNLNDVLAEVLGNFALKEDVEKVKKTNKKAEKFGVDGKVVTQDTDNPDMRLAKILSDLNAVK